MFGDARSGLFGDRGAADRAMPGLGDGAGARLASRKQRR